LMSVARFSPVNEYKVVVKRQLALTSLEDFAVLLRDGHFDLGNGFHSTSYMNPHALFDRPSVVLRLAQDLLDVIELVPFFIKRQTQVVAGPVTGGAQLAFVMAAFLDGVSKKGARVFHAPIHKIDGKLMMRKHYQELVQGKRVLLADDVRNTGSTFKEAFELVSACGGEVIATTELYDRLSVIHELPVPNIPLAEYRLEQDLVPADQCPQCKLGIPITRF